MFVNVIYQKFELGFPNVNFLPPRPTVTIEELIKKRPSSIHWRRPVEANTPSLTCDRLCDRRLFGRGVPRDGPRCGNGLWRLWMECSMDRVIEWRILGRRGPPLYIHVHCRICVSGVSLTFLDALPIPRATSIPGEGSAVRGFFSRICSICGGDKGHSYEKSDLES